MVEIDTLQVKISANAKEATSSLNSLADALKKVKTQLTGVNKNGVSVSDRLAKSLNEMNGALNSITTGGIKRLQKLANALNDYSDAVARIKAAGAGVAKDIKSVSRALSVDSNGSNAAQNDTVVNETTDLPSDKEIKANTKEWLEWYRSVERESKKAGETVKKTTNIFNKFFHSLARIAFYRAIRSALKAVTEAFSEGLKNAYAYSKQSEDFTRLADTLDRIKSITYQMVNQLGALWGEIKQFFLPAIEWLVEKVRYLAEKATEFMAALNGADTYLRAKYVAKAWDDATDSVKKYKNQLLGLDELNVLTEKNSSGKKEEDHSDDFEVVKVSDKIKQIGLSWGRLKAEFDSQLEDWRTTLLFGIGAAAIGAILLFGTSHKLLGLGLLVGSGIFIGKQIQMHWGEMKAEIKQAMDDYWVLFALGAIGLTVVGAALLFTQHYALGLGCILSGVALGVATIGMSWDVMYNDIKNAMEKYRWLFLAAGIGLLVAGAALLFTSHIALGLGCLVFGGFITVSEIALNWNQLRADVQTAFQKFAPLFAVMGLGSLAVGALLLFTGHIGLGLAMLIAGGFITVATIGFNWDNILNNLKATWEKIKNWWNTTVMAAVRRGVAAVENLLGFDINGDGIIGGVSTTHESSSGATHGGAHGKFATGGVPTRGTLFYAGESGPEFIGSMGGSSAVANTEQMTDAIYKAAYMGMSQALRENGGNGMSGYTPATGDDLFLIMRKKANAYNKMTGNPAFN